LVLLRSEFWVFSRHACRDKKVVGVFVRFRAPLHPLQSNTVNVTAQERSVTIVLQRKHPKVLTM
jgi:hypothetical protein